MDARRTSLNSNDLRGKLLRIKVKDGDIAPAEANQRGGAYTVPAGNLFPAGTARTAPEVYAMGFRNPFRVTLDKDNVAYVTDYSPDAREGRAVPWAGGHRPRRDRPQAGELRLAGLLQDRPRVLQVGLRDGRAAPGRRTRAVRVRQSGRGPHNTSKWVASGGPTVSPGLVDAADDEPGDLVLVQRQQPGQPERAPDGDAVRERVRAGRSESSAAPERRGHPAAVPAALPGDRRFAGGGVGAQGAAPYDYNAANPSATKFPPYFDGAFFLGEFTRDWLREVRLDSQNRVFKIIDSLPCGPVPATPARPWLCDNPMDMEFGPEGTLYLLTYGDGFFAINPDAGMMRWDYVKGQRAPIVSITATPTSGPAPLTVAFTSTRDRRRPGRLDPLRVGLRRERHGRLDRANPTHTYTVRGQYTAKLTVFDSSGKSTGANTTITVGNTAPTVTVNVPADGGLFAFGNNIPYSVTVTDDAPVNCANVVVTFVLGHSTHGHAQASSTGCTGVLPTEANDVSHDPNPSNVFGVISASYTDVGGAGGAPPLTTVAQNTIRQKLQEVEFVINQSGTNVAGSTDVGGGSQRGSLSAGDWMELVGPFNLVNINSLTFRVTGGTNGAASGTVELWRDAINAAGGGTLVSSQTITGTAAGTYASQTFPVTNPGGTHRLFLVFPNANTYSLNWVEFVGPGVGTP